MLAECLSNGKAGQHPSMGHDMDTGTVMHGARGPSGSGAVSTTDSRQCLCQRPAVRRPRQEMAVSGAVNPDSLGLVGDAHLGLGCLHGLSLGVGPCYGLCGYCGSISRNPERR